MLNTGRCVTLVYWIHYHYKIDCGLLSYKKQTHTSMIVQPVLKLISHLISISQFALLSYVHKIIVTFFFKYFIHDP